jgi:hypothetical protein
MSPYDAVVDTRARCHQPSHAPPLRGHVTMTASVESRQDNLQQQYVERRLATSWEANSSMRLSHLPLTRFAAQVWADSIAESKYARTEPPSPSPSSSKRILTVSGRTLLPSPNHLSRTRACTISTQHTVVPWNLHQLHRRHSSKRITLRTRIHTACGRKSTPHRA